MTIECLTFSETLEFCGPSSCGGCAGESRVRCVNCPTQSKKYCFTKAVSKKTGKQTALVMSRRRKNGCCPYQKKQVHCCH